MLTQLSPTKVYNHGGSYDRNLTVNIPVCSCFYSGGNYYPHVLSMLSLPVYDSCCCCTELMLSRVLLIGVLLVHNKACHKYLLIVRGILVVVHW